MLIATPWIVPLALASMVLTVALWPLRGLRPWPRSIGALWLAVAVAWLSLDVIGPPLAVTPGEAAPIDSHRLGLALAVLAAVFAGLQIADLVLWEAFLGRRRRVPRLLISVFNVLFITIAVLFVINYILLRPITGLLVTSTVVSAVVGLSLQDVLKNVVAGLALQVEAPVTLGDWILIGGHEGEVTQINWRTLTLRTRENNDVVITNAKVATEDITNFSHPSAHVAQDVYVDVNQDCPPSDVKAVLLAATRQVDGVCDEPAPYAFLDAYLDSSIRYRVRYWIVDFPRRPRIADAVASAFWYHLARADMALPNPVREVSLRQVMPDEAERARDAEREVATGCLRGVALLDSLSDAQVDAVAGGSRLQRFAAGEVLAHQGEPGDVLFAVRAGRVRVEVADDDGRRVHVATRGPGDLFGETSLLTGAPRSATVVADVDTEVVVVDKSAFAGVFLSDPHIVEALSDVLAARAAETAASLAALPRGEAPAPLSGRDAVVAKIRQVFGLDRPAS